MSSYNKLTKMPGTNAYMMAEWLDDYFGPHRYGVRFPDGQVFNAELYDLPTQESDHTPETLLNNDANGGDTVPMSKSSQESSPITQWRQSVEAVIEGATWFTGASFDPHFSREQAVKGITSATIELALSLIGEDEPKPRKANPDKGFYPDYQPTRKKHEVEGRNALRASLRQSLKEMEMNHNDT